MDPLSVLFLAVFLTVSISACCSLMEAALYAVPLPHVHHLAESGVRSGKILQEFKNDMGRPIAAILILNTIANTGGASVAGWAGAAVLSQSGLLIFSITFVLAILYVSEIFPKVVGVTYCKQVARLMAIPLYSLVKLLSPMVAVSQLLSKRIEEEQTEPAVSEQEVLSMAAIGQEEGAIDQFEGSVITNVVGLDRLFVRDVLTPRVVVFRLKEDTKIGELNDEIVDWNFSRVPLYVEDEPDHLVSYVTQRDIFLELLKGHSEKLLKSIARPLNVVPELMSADKLLLEMFEKKEHICGVVDEHGGLAGIITLEDIIEEIVGREIVDEYDTVSDLRTFARVMRVVRSRKKQ